MSEASPELLNPWTAVWTRPRDTIRHVVSTNPRQSVLAIAGLLGVGQVINRASDRNMGDRLPLEGILVLAVVLGPLVGVLSVYVWGFLLYLTGRWIGGRGTREEIRAAFCWAHVPVVASLPLWLPQLALFGRELFTSATPEIDATPPLGVAMLGFGLVQFALAVWGFVLLTKTLGEVQGFSAWKGLGNIVLPGLAFGLPLLVIVLLVALAR